MNVEQYTGQAHHRYQLEGSPVGGYMLVAAGMVLCAFGVYGLLRQAHSTGGPQAIEVTTPSAHPPRSIDDCLER